jgi:hypothetical protein
MVVGLVRGNANTGSSAFQGAIDKVSAVRYYKVTYYQGGGTPPAFPVVNFSPSYGTDDGVAAGNTDLRVAYSVDNRGTWKAMPQATPHTTSLAAPPTTIVPSALTAGDTLRDGGPPMYVALARATGTTTNSLDGSGTAVNSKEELPVSFELSQNFPNPFNPTTVISCRVPAAGWVTLAVNDILGREVAILANGQLAAGEHRFVVDARDLPSGVYFYTLRSGSFAQTRKMVLMK